MSTIRINDLYPPDAKGQRNPLPKQLEMMQRILDPNGPKYVAYISGIGGGKTLCGCITMLAMGLMHAGDYLIGRQYSPELKVTTYKQFLDICPKELIVEHRIADMQVKIKANGGYSNFYFRPLEEPDKFRSMNLSGFMIDECDQVSEEAFMLLQGRLRGPGLRKGILVSNPAGHNWAYRWFFKKDHMPREETKKDYYLIRGSSLENAHLPAGYIQSMLDTWSKDRIEREIMGSFDAFEGAVYEEFRRDTHVIKPFKIPEDWPRFVGIDHGYRNPAAWVFCATGPDGEVYVYKEFYEAGWLIGEIINGKRDRHIVTHPGVLELMKNDSKITQAFIDPSTKRTNGATGDSDLDEYVRHLPSDFPLYPANNDVQVGIDRVKSYLKVNPKTKKPNIYFFDNCVNTIEEMTQYKYQELRPNQVGNKAEHEKPKKVFDHAMDALRYVIVTLPEPYVKPVDPTSGLTPGSLAWRLAKEMDQIHTPKPKNHWEGGS